MQLLTPWSVQIGRININDRIIVEDIATEIHTLHLVSPREATVPHKATPEEFPAICSARDGVIKEAVQDYIRKVFGHEPKNLKIDTFGKAFEKYEGLDAHLHGNSNVTTVYYPYASNSGIRLFDPRGNASRGYPRSIRDSHFGELYIQPEAGDLLIIPSYVAHSVTAAEEHVRLSLINDFFFD